MLSFFTTSYAMATHPDGRLRAAPRRARAHPRRDRATARITQLLLGLLGVGMGVGLIISAELGVASWDVLHVGLSSHLGWSVGVTAMTVGVGAAGLALLLGERPRIGSLVPLLVVGPAIDVTLLVAPTAETFGGSLVLLLAGMVVLSVGVGAYVASDHGAGPADLVFLAVARRGMSLSLARFLVDGTVVLAGWAIGGPVGVGTVIVTAGLGPMVGAAIRGFDLVPARDAVAARSRRIDRDWGRQLDWELTG